MTPPTDRMAQTWERARTEPGLVRNTSIASGSS
jgi:hypothetical protein